MKKLLIGLLALGSISAFSSDNTYVISDVRSNEGFQIKYNDENASFFCLSRGYNEFATVVAITNMVSGYYSDQIDSDGKTLRKFNFEEDVSDTVDVIDTVICGSTVLE